ncbi:MAG: type II toxin-antitoxin system RelE/ParE family toxin [Candidatus Omnitrophica bacterium]|nr:type II toxin-antitoxin system RelE/ParE family toxin [Candidatus Omnitrophota bacterium]
MNYKVVFASPRIGKEFGRALEAIPQKSVRDEIMYKVEELAENPKPFPPNPKLQGAIPIFGQLAQYRIKVGRYRIFYDVNDRTLTVYVIALRIRDDKTYGRSR